MRQVDHVGGAAFDGTDKPGILITCIRERHWLILPSQDIKINAHGRGRDRQGPGENRSFISHKKQHLYSCPSSSAWESARLKIWLSPVQIRPGALFWLFQGLTPFHWFILFNSMHQTCTN